MASCIYDALFTAQYSVVPIIQTDDFRKIYKVVIEIKR